MSARTTDDVLEGVPRAPGGAPRALDGATGALEAAAGELGRVLAGDPEDAARLEEALAARARAFEALRAAVRGPVPPEIRARLERLVELDRALAARAAERMAALQAQLGELRRARRVARSLGAEAAPPRFVSERA